MGNGLGGGYALRQLTVMLTVIMVIMVVIFGSTGKEPVTSYLTQTMFQGQTVFLNDATEGFVNGEPAQVVHTGFVYVDKFQVTGVNLIGTIQTVRADHSVGGSLGKPGFLFDEIKSEEYEVGENMTLGNVILNYNNSFRTDQGYEMYVYSHENISVGVSYQDFSIIETEDNSFILLRQESGTVTVSEIEEPFNLGWKEIGFLASILVFTTIVAYWFVTFKKDWNWNYRKV